MINHSNGRDANKSVKILIISAQKEINYTEESYDFWRNIGDVRAGRA